MTDAELGPIVVPMFRFWPFKAPDDTTIDAFSRIMGRLERLESAHRTTPDLDAIRTTLTAVETGLGLEIDGTEALGNRLDDLESQAKDFVIALAEGIERTDRAERRIKATVTRARKELKARGYDDPGLDAEAYELREVDGEGRENGGVLPMRAPVEEDAQSASSVRGVSREALRRVRGI